MKRFEIINYLIKKHKYKRYLEIGTQADVCLSNIVCDYKVGVEPYPVLHDAKNSDKFHKKTSDDFFCKNNEKFDIIFIDGLHEKMQMYKDVNESLNILLPGGTIVVHDCNPLTRESQTPASWDGDKWHIPHRATWNGDIWKAWVTLRAKKPNLKMYVVNTDQGCGIIQRGHQECINIDISIKDLTYDYLEKHRKEWLNLISIEKFKILNVI